MKKVDKGQNILKPPNPAACIYYTPLVSFWILFQVSSRIKK